MRTEFEVVLVPFAQRRGYTGSAGVHHFVAWKLRTEMHMATAAGSAPTQRRGRNVSIHRTTTNHNLPPRGRNVSIHRTTTNHNLPPHGFFSPDVFLRQAGIDGKVVAAAACGVRALGDGDFDAGAAKRRRPLLPRRVDIVLAEKIARLEAAVARRDHRIAELAAENAGLAIEVATRKAREAVQQQRIGELTAEVAVLSLRLNRRRRSSSWSECSLPTSMTCGTACSIWSGLPVRGPRLVC